MFTNFVGSELPNYTLTCESEALTKIPYYAKFMEDEMIKVGKFIFLMDFVVMNIKEDKQVPLLLGRPFLATREALIDVKKGELILRIGYEEVHFNLNQSMKQLEIEKAGCKNVEKVVPSSFELNDDCKNQDSMNEKMMNFQYIEGLDIDILMPILS